MERLFKHIDQYYCLLSLFLKNFSVEIKHIKKKCESHGTNFRSEHTNVSPVQDKKIEYCRNPSFSPSKVTNLITTCVSFFSVCKYNVNGFIQNMFFCFWLLLNIVCKILNCSSGSTFRSMIEVWCGIRGIFPII